MNTEINNKTFWARKILLSITTIFAMIAFVTTTINGVHGGKYSYGWWGLDTTGYNNVYPLSVLGVFGIIFVVFSIITLILIPIVSKTTGKMALSKFDVATIVILSIGLALIVMVGILSYPELLAWKDSVISLMFELTASGITYTIIGVAWIFLYVVLLLCLPIGFITFESIRFFLKNKPKPKSKTKAKAKK